MIVYFANRSLEVLGIASTNLERSYVIKDDLQTEEVSTGISTLDLTVSWGMNDQKTLQEWMEVGNAVLMPQEEGRDEAKLYSIVQETIDTGSKSIEIYCEDAGLDFINEVAPAYSAGEAHEAQYYINKYLGDSGYEIGQNDMSTSASKKLSWDGESTVAERIQSIANSFGCEVSYTYQVHGMDVTHKYINLLSKRGDQETELQIRLNIEADKITASKSIEDLATAFIVTGGIPKDSQDNKPITLIGYSYDDGNYYVDKTTGRVCSKQGMQAWTRLSSKYYNVPSGDATSGQIVKTYSYDTTDKATLVSHAVAELKKVDHPSATYEVEIPKLPEGVWIGDRVSIVDDAGELYVSARILGLEISRTKQSVKITVGDYITRNAGISDQVEDLANQWSNSVAAMAEIAKQAAAAQSTADAANTAASKAQSTADSANTAAGNAQSTADGAATAAGKAQESVDTLETMTDKAITFDTSYTFSSANDVETANFEAHVYRYGEDVTSEFADSCFSWWRKLEGERTSGDMIRFATGKTCTVSLADCGYGATVVGQFETAGEASLLTTSSARLQTLDAVPLTAAASGEYVRVSDLPTGTPQSDDWLMGWSASSTYRATVANVLDAALQIATRSEIEGVLV